MVDEALIDLTQDRTSLRALYAPPAGEFTTVDVPKLPFAILDGGGPPEQISIGAAVKVTCTPSLDRPEPEFPGVWLRRQKVPMSLS